MSSGDLARAGGVFEHDGLVDRANQALRDMWSRLEILPAGDEFWSGTNHRPTWSKVEAFAGRCVSRNPSDDTARWALVGLSMRAGSFSGLQLLAGTVLDLIAVAEWVWLEVGVEPGAELAHALLRAGPDSRRRSAAQPGTQRGRAAAAAVEFLGGKSFVDAIGRRRWDMFVHALVAPTRNSADPAVVSEALILAGERAMAAARECLAADASAVTDLVDAARWWSVYRDVDVTDRLGELVQGRALRDRTVA